jgi:hypothetical protein
MPEPVLTMTVSAMPMGIVASRTCVSLRMPP